MNNWKYEKLFTACNSIYSGGTPNTKIKEYWNGKFNWLSSGETRNDYIFFTEKTITNDGVNNSSTRFVSKNNVVMASAGQGHTRGQTSFLRIDSYINQSVIALIADEVNLISKYLFYNLKNRYNELRALSDSNSSRGSITTKILGNLVINLPPLPTQRRIAGILSALDDKIENNRRICETLEHIAQAIFKRWFVDGKEENWAELDLQDVANITMGQSPPSNTYNFDGNGLPFFQGSKEFGWRKPLVEKWCDTPKRIAEKDNILISVRAPVGDMNITSEKCCIGRGLAAIQGKAVPTSVLYYAIQNSIHEIQNLASGGSVFDSLNKKSLAEVKIPILPDKIKESIYKQIDSIFVLINKLDDENRVLQQTRDTLLPKLMSGEVEV